MGFHIYIDLHLVNPVHEDIMDGDTSKIMDMSEVEFAEHEKYHFEAIATYQKAYAEIETLDDIDALSDWTETTHNGAVWSIALPKRVEMNPDLLALVESMRARGIIHGYTVYSSGA